MCVCAGLSWADFEELVFSLFRLERIFNLLAWQWNFCLNLHCSILNSYSLIILSIWLIFLLTKVSLYCIYALAVMFPVIFKLKFLLLNISKRCSFVLALGKETGRDKLSVVISALKEVFNQSLFLKKILFSD